MQTQTQAVDGYNMARACFDAGDDDEVLALTRAAVFLLTEPEKQFKNYLLMACAEWRKGWIKPSLETLGKAEELFDQVSPRLKGRFHGQRAVIHSKLDNRDEALVDLEAAKYWAEQAGDREETAIARNNLAKQYASTGRLEEALIESHAAIEFAETYGNDVLRGQFYDMRAQILIEASRFETAVRFSERAVRLLRSHPAEAEARETHGRALIGLGATYLEQSDPIASFCARRKAAAMIPTSLEKEVVEMALDRSNGQVSKAATYLNVHHTAMMKAARKYNAQRSPATPRLKSIINKK